MRYISTRNVHVKLDAIKDSFGELFHVFLIIYLCLSCMSKAIPSVALTAPTDVVGVCLLIS